MVAAPPQSPGAMTDPAHRDAQTFSLDPQVAKAFLHVAGRFWVGETARRAWLLTLALAGSLLASTWVTVQMNHWNRWFFDALERKDIATVKEAVFVFFGIIAVMAAIGVAIVMTRETLQVRWRQWLVGHLLDRWLDNRRFYFLGVTGHEPDNPEYRISDDTRWATEMLVDLGIGLLSALVGGLAFISILWSVGGSLTIGTFILPGYMVWIAIAYGVTASVLMAWVGRPLVGRVGTKNESEGSFRFAMMRLRDNAESIALMGGHHDERQTLSRLYDTVAGRWLRIVRSHGHVTWITNATGPMIPIVPLLFAAPKYLAGDLSLGQVTQLAAAFVQVQMAISWIVDNYNRIAEWYASARRVMAIIEACDAVDPLIVRHDRAQAPSEGDFFRPGGGELVLEGIGVDDANGTPLIASADLRVRAGESVHVHGNSSIGKSTLVRVIGGLVVPARGRVVMHEAAKILIITQKTYVPLGTLREVLHYPHVGRVLRHGNFRGILKDGKWTQPIEDALGVVGLPGLVSRLDEPARWDQLLSAGERQRLAIARALLHEPEIVILDDAVSALEEPVQVSLLGAVRRAMPLAIILSFAQRPLPRPAASRQYSIETSRRGATLRPFEPPASSIESIVRISP
jgi:vitamin B12/bleomycin/antimicrobial peptide transport system ATP-binding/permease protein